MNAPQYYRIGVVVALLATGGFCVMGYARQGAAEPNSRPAASYSVTETDAWFVCNNVVDVDAFLAAAQEQVANPPVLTRPADLKLCLDAVLRSMCSGSSAPYKESMVVAPRTLHSEPYIKFLREEVKPEVLPDATAELAPADAWYYLLDHPERRNMTLVGIQKEDVRSGRGVTLDQAEEWQSTSVFSQLSMVQTPEGGFFNQELAKDLDLESESFWLDFVGDFSEGYQSRVRVLFYFNRQHAHWFPLAIIIDDPQMMMKDDPNVVLRPWPII